MMTGNFVTKLTLEWSTHSYKKALSFINVKHNVEHRSMVIFKKLVSLLFISTTTMNTYSQEMNVGIGSGFISDFNFKYPSVNLNAIFEIRPGAPRISFQTNPGVLITDENVLGAFPLYINFILGNTFKVCPSIGGFYWTDQRWGFSGGLNIQYDFKEQYNLFLRAEYLKVIYEEYYPYHFGGGEYFTTSEPALSLSIGMKYQILTN